VARTIVIITLSLWLLFFLFCLSVAQLPLLAVLPLYGLYPGPVASGEPGYNPTAANVWAIGFGVVLLALAVPGIVYKNKHAALVLVILFIISTVACWMRVAEVFSGMH
jgi:hypothetical protein